MEFDWNTGELAEGLRCYRDRQFWHAHEHWEAVWLKLDGQEKRFLQALIQTTAAFHHFQRGNLVGTASLLRNALQKLDQLPECFGGIEVEVLRKSLRGGSRNSIEGQPPTTWHFLRFADRQCPICATSIRAAERRPPSTQPNRFTSSDM